MKNNAINHTSNAIKRKVSPLTGKTGIRKLALRTAPIKMALAASIIPGEENLPEIIILICWVTGVGCFTFLTM